MISYEKSSSKFLRKIAQNLPKSRTKRTEISVLNTFKLVVSYLDKGQLRSEIEKNLDTYFTQFNKYVQEFDQLPSEDSTETEQIGKSEEPIDINSKLVVDVSHMKNELSTELNLAFLLTSQITDVATIVFKLPPSETLYITAKQTLVNYLAASLISQFNQNSSLTYLSLLSFNSVVSCFLNDSKCDQSFDSGNVATVLSTLNSNTAYFFSGFIGLWLVKSHPIAFEPSRLRLLLECLSCHIKAANNNYSSKSLLSSDDNPLEINDALLALFVAYASILKESSIVGDAANGVLLAICDAIRLLTTIVLSSSGLIWRDILAPTLSDLLVNTAFELDMCPCDTPIVNRALLEWFCEPDSNQSPDDAQSNCGRLEPVPLSLLAVERLALYNGRKRTPNSLSRSEGRESKDYDGDDDTQVENGAGDNDIPLDNINIYDNDENNLFTLDRLGNRDPDWKISIESQIVIHDDDVTPPITTAGLQGANVCDIDAMLSEIAAQTKLQNELVAEKQTHTQTLTRIHNHNRKRMKSLKSNGNDIDTGIATNNNRDSTQRFRGHETESDPTFSSTTHDHISSREVSANKKQFNVKTVDLVQIHSTSAIGSELTTTVPKADLKPTSRATRSRAAADEVSEIANNDSLVAQLEVRKSKRTKNLFGHSADSDDRDEASTASTATLQLTRRSARNVKSSSYA